MNMNKDWKLVPVEPTAEMWAAVNTLDDQMAAGGYDGKGASIEQAWNCLVETAPEAPPLTVTVDPDPRGVSVGVYQGSRCVYSEAHPIPASTQADERDWELTCEGCDGDGFVYVERRVGMCATDVQTFKEECECCEGRGFVFAFEDIPGIAEYVKSCRPASTVATEGEKDETAPWEQAFEVWWEDHGQYCRAGGGQYEKTFAYRAYKAALASRPAPAAGDALEKK